MAEVNNTTPTKKAGKPDMTPMVDLGFLLITFFIYTTTFTIPNVVDFNTPSSNVEKSADVKFKNTVTLLLDGENRIYWYQAPLESLRLDDVTSTDYSPAGVRKTILELKKQCPDPHKWTVIIKPTSEATWKNTVDILDETAITQSERKAVNDLTEKELQILRELK